METKKTLWMWCVCPLCLSKDRNLYVMNDAHSNLTVALDIFKNKNPKRAVCWECLAVLDKVGRFRSNALQAQQLLQGKPTPEILNNSFSRLKLSIQTEVISMIADETEKPIKEVELSPLPSLLTPVPNVQSLPSSPPPQLQSPQPHLDWPPPPLQSPQPHLESPPPPLQSPQPHLDSPPPPFQSPQPHLKSLKPLLQSPPPLSQSLAPSLQSPPLPLQLPLTPSQSPSLHLQSPPPTSESLPPSLQSSTPPLQSPPSPLQLPPPPSQTPSLHLQSPPPSSESLSPSLQSSPPPLQSPPSPLQLPPPTSQSPSLHLQSPPLTSESLPPSLQSSTPPLQSPPSPLQLPPSPLQLPPPPSQTPSLHLPSPPPSSESLSPSLQSSQPPLQSPPPPPLQSSQPCRPASPIDLPSPLPSSTPSWLPLLLSTPPSPSQLPLPHQPSSPICMLSSPPQLSSKQLTSSQPVLLPLPPSTSFSTPPTPLSLPPLPPLQPSPYISVKLKQNDLPKLGNITPKPIYIFVKKQKHYVNTASHKQTKDDTSLVGQKSTKPRTELTKLPGLAVLAPDTSQNVSVITANMFVGNSCVRNTNGSFQKEKKRYLGKVISIDDNDKAKMCSKMFLNSSQIKVIPDRKSDNLKSDKDNHNKPIYISSDNEENSHKSNQECNYMLESIANENLTNKDFSTKQCWKQEILTTKVTAKESDTNENDSRQDFKFINVDIQKQKSENVNTSNDRSCTASDNLINQNAHNNILTNVLDTINKSYDTNEQIQEYPLHEQKNKMLRNKRSLLRIDSENIPAPQTKEDVSFERNISKICEIQLDNSTRNNIVNCDSNKASSDFLKCFSNNHENKEELKSNEKIINTIPLLIHDVMTPCQQFPTINKIHNKLGHFSSLAKVKTKSLTVNNTCQTLLNEHKSKPQLIVNKITADRPWEKAFHSKYSRKIPVSPKALNPPRFQNRQSFKRQYTNKRKHRKINLDTVAALKIVMRDHCYDEYYRNILDLFEKDSKHTSAASSVHNEYDTEADISSLVAHELSNHDSLNATSDVENNYLISNPIKNNFNDMKDETSNASSDDIPISYMNMSLSIDMKEFFPDSPKNNRDGHKIKDEYDNGSETESAYSNEEYEMENEGVHIKQELIDNFYELTNSTSEFNDSFENSELDFKYNYNVPVEINFAEPSNNEQSLTSCDSSSLLKKKIRHTADEKIENFLDSQKYCETQESVKKSITSVKKNKGKKSKNTTNNMLDISSNIAEQLTNTSLLEPIRFSYCIDEKYKHASREKKKSQESTNTKNMYTKAKNNDGSASHQNGKAKRKRRALERRIQSQSRNTQNSDNRDKSNRQLRKRFKTDTRKEENIQKDINGGESASHAVAKSKISYSKNKNKKAKNMGKNKKVNMLKKINNNKLPPTRCMETKSSDYINKQSNKKINQHINESAMLKNVTDQIHLRDTILIVNMKHNDNLNQTCSIKNTQNNYNNYDDKPTIFPTLSTVESDKHNTFKNIINKDIQKIEKYDTQKNMNTSKLLCTREAKTTNGLDRKISKKNNCDAKKVISSENINGLLLPELADNDKCNEFNSTTTNDVNKTVVTDFINDYKKLDIDDIRSFSEDDIPLNKLNNDTPYVIYDGVSKEIEDSDKSNKKRNATRKKRSFPKKIKGNINKSKLKESEIYLPKLLLRPVVELVKIDEHYDLNKIVNIQKEYLNNLDINYSHKDRLAPTDFIENNKEITLDELGELSDDELDFEAEDTKIEELSNTHVDQMENKRSKNKNTQELIESLYIKEIIDKDNVKVLKDKVKCDIVFKSAPHKCFLCTQVFRVERKLKRHLKFHEEASGNFACGVCALRFRSQRLLNQHNRLKHKWCFKCRLCNKKYMFQNMFEDHVQLTHAEAYAVQVVQQNKLNSVLGRTLSHMAKHGPKRSTNGCEANDKKIQRNRLPKKRKGLTKKKSRSKNKFLSEKRAISIKSVDNSFTRNVNSKSSETELCPTKNNSELSEEYSLSKNNPKSPENNSSAENPHSETVNEKLPNSVYDYDEENNGCSIM